MLRIPVTIVDDACVGCCQVNPQPASSRITVELVYQKIWLLTSNLPCAQKENVELWIAVELVDVVLTVEEIHASIQSAEFPFLEVAVVSKNVQHFSHLEKNYLKNNKIGKTNGDLPERRSGFCGHRR